MRDSQETQQFKDLLRSEHERLFPVFGIYAASTAILLASLKDVAEVGFHWGWLAIRLGYLPVIVATYLFAKRNPFIRKHAYELPSWISAGYITVYTIYFSHFTGHLKSDYVLALVQTFTAIALMPVTPLCFYGVVFGSSFSYLIWNVGFGPGGLGDHSGVAPITIPSIFFSILIYNVTSHMRREKILLQNKLVNNLANQSVLIEEQSKKLIKKETEARLGQLASQVAHDIRSPLTALSSFTEELTSVPQRKRLVVQSAVARIQDIANNLLQSANLERAEGTEEPTRLTPQLISPLIEEIVSEKRSQYRSRMGIEIKAKMEGRSRRAFAAVRPTELKTILSNLIDNSIEAMASEGKVEVELRQMHATLILRVRDNGRGIDAGIVPKLMKKGATFGKENGHGLGLFHAKKTIRRWEGEIKLDSALNQGTTVTIKLPLSAPPAHFAAEILVFDGQPVVILDDDCSIHHMWRDRLGDQPIHSFSKIRELLKWQQARTPDSPTPLYLIDYEIVGENLNGLEVIEKYGISNQSILVTSHYREDGVIQGVIELGTRLLPKPFAATIPIVQLELDSDRFDCVLLDNDPFTHLSWNAAAEKYNRKLAGFSKSEDLLSHLSFISLETPIYVDYQLDEETTGGQLTEILASKGYSNLYITSGLPASQLPRLPWVREISGKSPPWIEGSPNRKEKTNEAS